jgi:hypothetical protein
VDGVKQHLVIDWLLKEIDGVGLERAHARWHVGVTADEDDRDVVPGPVEAFLELEPARPRQAQVEHHAGWTVQHRLAQKILSRCEGLDVEVHRPQEPLE